MFGISWRDGSVYPGVPVMLDLSTNRARIGSATAAQFAGECVPVRSGEANGCWLLTLVLDAERGCSELHVLDGKDIAAPPVAVARLPHVIPFGFHGTWIDAKPDSSC